MSSINKIKLPNGTTYDVNDVRILGVDSSPTSGSGNVVTSGGVYTSLSGKAPLASPALTGTPTAPTATAGTNTTQIATTAFVGTAISNIPKAMQFKGSLGTGGTITDLPTADSSNSGWTYKVITAGTYSSIAAKVGDLFISTGLEWVLIPSGDEPSGTVTSVATGTGLTGGPVTSSGTISHADTSSQASVSNSGRTYIQSVTLDGMGHVTGLSSATETVVNTNTAQLQVSDTTNKRINTVESTGKYIQFTGGTNKFNVSDGTNNFDVAITPSVTFPVTSVNSQTGAVSLNLDNIADGSTRKLANYVAKSGDTMTGQLYINYDQDASATNQNGSLVIGTKTGENIAIDGNEIMARNNSTASTLYINNDGGSVIINGSSGTGSVGIGTSSPSERLHVSGGVLAITNNGGTLKLGASNSSFFHITGSDARTFYFGNNSTFAGAVYPYTDNSYNSGTNSNRWANVYSRNVYIGSASGSQCIQQYDSTNKCLKFIFD